MKSRLHLPLYALLIFSLLASACSSASKTSSSSSASQGQPGNNTLSPATRLALGTLKLEGTAQAVTIDQASTLVTLWQAYQSLNNSDTSAQEELDGLLKQIRAAMTSDQNKAIDAMQLTSQSMNEVMQSLGLTMGGPSGAQSTPVAGQSSSGRSGFNGNFPSGGAAGGGPAGGGPGNPPGGGFPGGDMGGGLPPDAVGGTGGAQVTPNATQQARVSAMASRVNPMVLNALITTLENKIKPAQ